MSARIPRTLLVLLLAATITGCTTPEPPEEADPGPSAGQCLAGSVAETDGTINPDLAAVVDCAADHLYEVVAVLPVPEEFLGGEAVAEQLAHREQLAAKAMKAGDEFARWADVECGHQLATLTGLSAVPAEFDHRDAAVVPAGAFLPQASITDEPLWARGVQSVVCTVRWLDPSDAATSRPLALPQGLSIAEFFSSTMPLQTRQCLALANGQLSPTGCDLPHFSEPVLTFDAAVVLGADWAASVDPTAPTREQHAALDAVCAAFLPISVGGTNPAIAIRGELTSTGWMDAQDGSAYRGAYCALVSSQSADYDVAGSLVGTAESEPTLVAIP